MQIGPDGPVLTAKKGTNADLFPDIMRLYVADGADVLVVNGAVVLVVRAYGHHAVGAFGQ